MKKFVRGQFGRALSTMLMVIMLLPSLLLPFASAGYATTGGRQNIILLPLQVAAKNAPYNIGERILEQVLVDLSNQEGVQVNILLRTSPMLTRAQQQLEE